jgi:hypothetical protein
MVLDHLPQKASLPYLLQESTSHSAGSRSFEVHEGGKKFGRDPLSSFRLLPHLFRMLEGSGLAIVERSNGLLAFLLLEKHISISLEEPPTFWI